MRAVKWDRTVRNRLGNQASLVLLLMLPLTMLLASAPARAQTADDLAAYVERTAELLDWAAELVRETESVPARRVLQEAKNLHERSLLLLTERPVLALEVGRRARTAVWYAVKLAREALNFEERVRVRSERFRDLHGQLMERAREGGDTRTVDLLRRAEEQFLRAREQLEQGDARLSFQLLEQAEHFLQRASRLLAEQGGPERLERELERTGTVIERARGRLEGDEAARRLLDEARQMLLRAREHRDEGRPGLALQMTGMARSLALRAGAQSDGGPRPEAVESQIAAWDERSARVGEKLSESAAGPAAKAFRSALEHRRRAGEALAAGKPEEALRQIKAAHDLLGQAEDMAR